MPGDSLVLNNNIQFLGLAKFGGAQAPKATYTLARDGLDFGAPAPLVDIVSELILDGEQPTGDRAGNRVITLPVIVRAPDRPTLAKAVEYLLQTVNQSDFELAWTPDPGPGGTPLPLIFDCFRMAQPAVESSLLNEHALLKMVTISFEALPYGRADKPRQITFTSAATGTVPPPSPVTVDNFAVFGSGAHFTASTAGIIGAHSAHWAATGGLDLPLYSSPSLGPVDISALGAVSVYAGLGSSASAYNQWRSGTVHFTLTLFDAAGRSTAVSAAQVCATSNNTAAPTWQQVTFSIPSNGDANLAAITRYTLSAYNQFYYSFQYMTADTYFNGLVAQPVSTGVAASVRGVVNTLYGVLGSAPTALNLLAQQAPVSLAESVTYSTPGAILYIPEAGVTLLTVEKWGGGAAGVSRTTAGQGSGGKGGEYTKNTAFPCSEGVPIAGFVPAGGVASTTSPTNGGDAWFGANDSTAAHGGVTGAVNTATAANTATGTSTDPVHNAGGSPAAGGPNGGGGGEAGGPAGAGNAGSGAVGGTGLADAGDGGAGRSSTAGNGTAGSGPGGGGGGCFSSGASQTGGNGAAGQVRVSWTRVLAPWGTLLVHLPGQDAPQNLSPFVSVGNGADTPNGLTEYTVPSLVAGTLADFDGTYTMMAANFSWSSPSSARTVFVTVRQYEYTGGPSYSASTLPRTITPSTDTNIAGGMVSLGELTLPIKEVAPDNTTGFYTITITSSNTADRFLDVLFLDTSGQLVLLSSATLYTSYWIDEPDSTTDVGLVLGSSFNRSQAIGVLDQCELVSGGPPRLRPGDNLLFLYSPSGAPAAVATYFDRYFYNRTAA